MLAPGEPVRTLRVQGLMHVPESGDAYPVDVANRAMDTYSFLSPFPLEKADIARIERAEGTSKPVSDTSALKSE